MLVLGFTDSNNFDTNICSSLIILCVYIAAYHIASGGKYSQMFNFAIIHEKFFEWLFILSLAPNVFFLCMTTGC